MFTFIFQCRLPLPLIDELIMLVVPEIQWFRMSRCEAFYSSNSTHLHPHQLVSDPQSWGKINIKTHSFAHTWGDVVLPYTEVHARLKPVDVTEGETVANIVLNCKKNNSSSYLVVNINPTLLTLFLFFIIPLPCYSVLTKPDLLPILPAPGYGGSSRGKTWFTKKHENVFITSGFLLHHNLV